MLYGYCSSASQSQIREIARVARISEEMVKRDIFGEELFNEEYDYASLTKFKRDIAKDIGIDGVL